MVGFGELQRSRLGGKQLAAVGPPTRSTASTTLPPRSMRSRHGPAPARSSLTATGLAPAPIWLAAQRSTGFIDIDRQSL